jgi:hypothetical protein
MAAGIKGELVAPGRVTTLASAAGRAAPTLAMFQTERSFSM